MASAKSRFINAFAKFVQIVQCSGDTIKYNNKIIVLITSVCIIHSVQEKRF